MVLAPELVGFLCAAALLVQVSPGEAGRHLPPPTTLSFKWIDSFTVNVSWSWTRPETLTKGCEIKYEIHLVDLTDPKQVFDKAQTTHKYYINYYLTQKVNQNKLKFNVYTLSECSGWNQSKPSEITISRPKTYAKLMQDFKCLYESDGLNCSWIPVNPSSDLSIFYRHCGKNEEDIRSLGKCDQPYRIKDRHGCFLKADRSRTVCVLAETKTEMETFNPQYMTRLTRLNIRENGDYLRLSWTFPEVGQDCTWIYSIVYTECDEEKSREFPDLEGLNRSVEIPYDKCCEYKFQYKLSTNDYCKEVSSDKSDVITYGERKPCIRPITVVAIVIPILLLLCLMLSCYCFNRNKHIFFQNVEDPSRFKNMLNGLMMSKDMVYKPSMEQVQASVTLLPGNGEPLP
ncbi:uncharacterized protein LOC108250046 [Kryptolebias marmoratus]|uniref:uncharacterized protein LOC108250046 n=1 Tax=Kryptolebias marmoratus TaxID=37003 RepID=UPI0007F8A1D7|nr:uncharacterized protein LOC108250046 [Kryptolebias marmoratus]